MSFHKTDLKHYVTLNRSPFFSQLTDEEKLYEYLMQDNVMAHTVNSSVDALDEVCGE
jgi:hypothetical protein